LKPKTNRAHLRLIARHPEKVRDLARRGAKVIAGEHSDPAVVEQAVRDADALFWLTPLEITSHDPLVMARRMADTGASVIRKHPDLHAGSVKAPFIATQDIAEIAAEFLLSPIDGHHVVDIVGPQEISFDEWASIAGQAIGKQVRVVTIPGDKLKAAMSQGGMSPEMAALLVEMEGAYPKIQSQFKGEQKRIGKVTFSQFAREVFAPGYKKAVQSAA
jgi:uncharacterized protein YbjT (DUF2867 family)